ncbi:MAG: hypothetical protein HC781_22775 [Leptolyngbyaceae cyanobacterium CSU_1_4]|nr:hypothetical protein [Leptolyngbyaceae cyanobacterium CSU_1_4]
MSWKLMGTVTPTDEWSLFPVPTYASTFRITYGGNLALVQSYGYLRQFYAVGQVSQAVRLYPKSESVIFELPIPQDLIDYGQVQRYLSIKKIFNRYRSFDVWWTAKLEELI